MSKPIEIIEAKRWRNTVTGQTASIYGAVPWGNNADKCNWKLEQAGYTFRRADGTVGTGPNGPFKNREDAQRMFDHISQL